MNLASQKAVLEWRERFGKATRDQEYFGALRERSPDKLKPILVQRNNSDWIAAYSVQKIGSGGRRILVKAASWMILRAKKSAKIISVPKPKQRAFEDLVRHQEAFHKVLYKFINGEKSGE